MSYRAAIFDMDGTILDTLGDLTDSLNYALEATGHRAGFSRNDVAAFFGSGVYVAIKRALSVEMGFPRDMLELIGTDREPAGCFSDEAEIGRVSAVYRPYYDSHCDIKTAPYPGIPELLTEIRAAGIKTAVVSNKPDAAVSTLVEDLFPGCFDFAIGEKSGLRRKPDPDMVDECLKSLGVSRESSVYIGDSEVDYATGVNCSMPVISVDWGFRSRDFLEAIPVQKIVSDADELKGELLR